MNRIWMILLAAVVLAGCGHKQLAYTPAQSPSMDRQQAIDIIEQVFYEDFSDEKPQSVVVTDKYIVLSDGLVTEGNSYGSAVPIGNGAIAVGSTNLSTKELGQRLYFNSMGQFDVYEHRGRSSRFAVIIIAKDGDDMRTVRMRTLDKAKRFVDALEYLKTHSS